MDLQYKNYFKKAIKGGGVKHYEILFSLTRMSLFFKCVKHTSYHAYPIYTAYS